MAMIKKIKYQSGYKYQLIKDYCIQINIYPIAPIHSQDIHLYCDGTLIIMAGYAWDGPSGPTIDTKTFMRGSLVHDVIYQLIRQGYLHISARHKADELLRKICLEDGMCKLRAWWVFQAVDKFAGSAADPDNKRKILTAP